MSKPVVLVIGNDAFATRVAELARDAGNIVALASPVVKDMDKVRTITIDPASHDSVLAAFEETLAAYDRINAVLMAFVPQAGEKTAIPGADQTALQTSLNPTVRVAKIALHHARRMGGDKTMAWTAISGPDSDIMGQTAAGAIVGTYRSLLARFAAQNTHSALVRSEAGDEVTAAALVACINPDATPEAASLSIASSMSQRISAKVHLVEKDGSVSTVSALQGTPGGFQYSHIFNRLAGLVMFAEDTTRRKINGGGIRTLASAGLLALLALLARKFNIVGRLMARFQ